MSLRLHRWILVVAPSLLSLSLGCTVTSTPTGGTGTSTSGSGGSTSSTSSTGGSGGSTTTSSSSTGGTMDPCAGGTPDPVPAASSVSGYGFVELDTTPDNPILELTTTLVVPPQPPPSGTLFLWPGLQPLPGGANYLPIDNGVLQPVLTWGPTCAPHAPSSPYADWWVSAQYVNTVGHANGFTGCQGGPGMTVPVGDTLTMTMTLKGTTWAQTVTSMANGTSVSFDLDLQGQSQSRALFLIEEYSSQPTVPVQFGATVVTFTNPEPSACHVLQQGMTDVVSVPVASVDGTRCCIPSMTLKAQGI